MEEFKAAVEQRLAEWFRDRQRDAPTPEAREMVGRMERLVLRAGKRSRPGLLFLTYGAYGGTDTEQLVDIGLALELHHQFLLVHDDIMDNDTVRYDGLNILGYYREDFPPDKSDIADSMALMAGNLLFSYANQAILEHPSLTPKQKVAVLKLMHETNLGVHAGQQLDIVNVVQLQPKLTLDVLLQTNFLKTALYSVQLPMQVAAELLDLPPAERKHINDFANAFGVLYQLVDDHSDYFQNASSFNNHPKYRDFRQGKITYPLLVALEKAVPDDQAFLQKHLGQKEASDQTMAQIVTIFERSGAEQASKELIEDYVARTNTALAKLHIDTNAAKTFTALLAKYQI